MAGEFCTWATCQGCGRCDAPWDAEPEELDDEPDADFEESRRESTEALIRRANYDELYQRAVQRVFADKDVA